MSRFELGVWRKNLYLRRKTIKKDPKQSERPRNRRDQGKNFGERKENVRESWGAKSSVKHVGKPVKWGCERDKRRRRGTKAELAIRHERTLPHH